MARDLDEMIESFFSPSTYFAEIVSLFLISIYVIFTLNTLLSPAKCICIKQVVGC